MPLRRCALSDASCLLVVRKSIAAASDWEGCFSVGCTAWFVAAQFLGAGCVHVCGQCFCPQTSCRNKNSRRACRWCGSARAAQRALLAEPLWADRASVGLL